MYHPGYHEENKDSDASSVQCICLQKEKEERSQMNVRVGCPKCNFYLSKGLLAWLHPLDRIGHDLFSEVSQRAGDV